MLDLTGYTLPETDEALLSECDVSTFKSTGPGGQGVNTTDSAVRLRHRPSGIVVTCRRERSQHLNKNACLKRLRLRIQEAQTVRPERKPTRKSAAADQRRLDAKRRVAQRKRSRRATPEEE
jgi:protein subunit release factor B